MFQKARPPNKALQQPNLQFQRQFVLFALIRAAHNLRVIPSHVVANIYAVPHLRVALR